MKPRNIVRQKLTFQIGEAKPYKDTKFCTWKQLLETQGPLPTDTLDNFTYKELKQSNFGRYDPDDNAPTYYAASVILIREREENDSEYFIRMKDEQHSQEAKERIEKNEYLRLKAKYGNLEE